MKKVLSILMIFVLGVGLAACGQNDGNGSSSGKRSSQGGNVLVAYFSWSGNTEEMASYIAEQAGGDLLEICLLYTSEIRKFVMEHQGEQHA